ncbi:uncharacterized protein BDV14DRAFT_201036 [Aspergillus stella-maris]|uniref:uncharacterized protein n=1 Tax=Aspergillus stella-maris TaxID=1810926 RepID=UPI003CCE44EC
MALFSEDNSYPQSLIVNPATWRQSVHLSPKSRSPLCQHSLEFSFRVLRTWPRMMARDLDPPPLFHLTQLVPERMATPLANCFAIVKMWQGHWGIAAGGLVHDTTVRELYRKFTEPELVATLQALSIYMILLLFPSSSTNTNTDISIPTIHMVILANMQKLVHHATSTAPGLTLPEETTHTVPLWHSWIKTTSRRRAVFALYLIHWSLSTYYGLPALDCEELKLMLAPAAKGLWQAKDAEVWGEKYRQWLGEWAGVEYLHGEVAEIVGGVCLDRRGERWLEETDELGLLLLALGERVKLDREKL